MNSGILIATALLTIGPADGSPEWRTDYASAQQIAAAEKRPLAIFLGSGERGFGQVCRDGGLSPDVQKLLFENYVCVYVDVSKASTQELVKAFAVDAGKGLVVSDRTGDYQAFHHDGDLSTRELTEILRRHSEPAPAADSYITLTGANFNSEVGKSKHPVLVDFHADWCGPCRRMGPVVAELATDFRGRAKVGKLNTDHNRDLAAKYGISAIPAFLIFQDGQIVDRLVGSTSKAELANRLNAALKNGPPIR